MSDANHQGQLAFGDCPDTTMVRDYNVSLLALSEINGLGHKTLRFLDITYHGELWRVWSNPSHLRHILINAHVKAAEEIVEAICAGESVLMARGQEKLKQLSERGIQIIPHQELPERLRELPSGPRWLFLEGERKTLYANPMIAVVGTRAASLQGLRATNKVIRSLSAYPVTIVSGLAEGIDAACHRASLVQGIPNVAILGCGIDIYFPSSTQDLRKNLVSAGGAVITEYLPTEPYRKEQFVVRNRLQAALSDLVIPIEGSEKGGTSHTVRFAKELDRPLIGIYWEGAKSFLTHSDSNVLMEINLTSERDWVKFDAEVRALVERYEKSTNALSRVEKVLMSEYRSRAVRLDDIERLQAILKKLAKEIRNDYSS